MDRADPPLREITRHSTIHLFLNIIIILAILLVQLIIGIIFLAIIRFLHLVRAHLPDIFRICRRIIAFL